MVHGIDKLQFQKEPFFSSPSSTALPLLANWNPGTQREGLESMVMEVMGMRGMKVRRQWHIMNFP
jgi:hypothetical protein